MTRLATPLRDGVIVEKQVDYFAIIQKYIPPDSLTYRLYVPHVSLVTFKALRVARRLGLDKAQRRFIEEAAMLHDIGIVRVHEPRMGCYGDLPYIRHLMEGRKILEGEGLPRHARVAANHVGMGITKDEIVSQGLDLPHEDIFPESIEEEVISWADLFFGKNPGSLWREREVDEVRAHLHKWGERVVETFDIWLQRFGE